MTKVHHRAFAGFFAILFLVTSSALAIAVIVTLIQQHNQGNSNNASTTGSKNTTSSSSPNSSKGKLAGFTPTASVSQLQETDLKVGSGAVVKAGDTITAQYTGAVAATGDIFQSATDQFSLNEVIAGWSQGIPGMRVGGTRQLLIPANLAYGANPPSGSGIPPNAALVFNVTVVKID
jgi:FKBP-type peptidyl-prolyl cis-trans isomerase